MGLAASQVRFLSLQNRKSTIGNDLSTMANRKMALNRQMKAVNEKYNAALEEKQLKFSTDSGATYSDLSYNLLMKQNTKNGSSPYIITSADGKVVIDDEKLTDADGNKLDYSYRDIAEIISNYKSNLGAFTASAGTAPSGILASGNATNIDYKIPTSADDFDENSSLRLDLMQKLNIITGVQAAEITLALNNIYGSPAAKKDHSYPANSLIGLYQTAEKEYLNSYISGTTTEQETAKTKEEEALSKLNSAKENLNSILANTNTKQMDFYDTIFQRIAQKGWVYDDKINTGDTSANQKYLNGMLENTMYFITDVNSTDSSDYDYTTKIAKNVSTLFQVADSSSNDVIESDYEAEKTLISSKEKDIDTKMESLETEQSAIKTELDSLKKVMSDNISSTFKMDM